ncbi:MAG: NADH-quinone oxidoreductase subunit J [Phycisphaerales bacterium]
MGTILNPFLLYGLIALGGVGVCLSLPRKGLSPQVIGAIIAGTAGGLLVLLLTQKAAVAGAIPNIYFYIFSGIALGGALRVITHQRPVYAALYFILSIIATSGLFLILSAEFMAFALIIVYAGAILITYLFVIMLATQAPDEGEIEVLAEYDTAAREPIAATVVGFLLLALLTTMMFRGVGELPKPTGADDQRLLASMPLKVQRTLRNHGLLGDHENVTSVSLVENAEGEITALQLTLKGGGESVVPKEKWPEGLDVTNVEALGFNLLRDHPGAIEIAGVVLLMAMLGAVVLSRKQVQYDEDAKMRQARTLAEGGSR